MNPTLAGFLLFLRNQAGVPTAALPDDSVYVTWAYDVAVEIVQQALQAASPTVYMLAVYNLATSNLIHFAGDTAPSTYFADLRKKLDINGEVLGVLTSTSDEGTSVSVQAPDFVKNLSLSDLQYLEDPFGRQYVAFAQRYGSVWGLT